MAASYPGSVKVFSARSNGQTIDAAHVNDLQDEVSAIESGLLNGTAPMTSSNATVNNLQVNANSTIVGSLSVGVNVNIQGASSCANLNVTGNSTVVGSLAVGVNLNVAGASSVANLNVTGNSTVVGSQQIGVNLTVGGASTFTGPVTLAHAVIGAGLQNFVISNGNQNNLAVGSSVFHMRIAASSNSTITGIQTAAGAVGRLLWLSNVGTSGTIVLTHVDVTSDSTNRFLARNSSAVSVPVGGNVMLIYDFQEVWRVLGNL